MSDDFFRTRRGAMFYDVTVPKIADQLELLNKNLEAIVAKFKLSNASPPAPSDTQEAPVNSPGASILD